MELLFFFLLRLARSLASSSPIGFPLRCLRYPPPSLPLVYTLRFVLGRPRPGHCYDIGEGSGAAAARRAGPQSERVRTGDYLFRWKMVL